MSVLEIPLSPQQKTMSISLSGTVYLLRFTFDEADQGGWIMDIGAPDGTLLLAGIPLVTGADLLAQHGHVGIGGAMVVVSDRDVGEAPGYADLGTTSHLYFIPSA